MTTLLFLEFLFAFSHRVLSGIQSGAAYSKKNKAVEIIASLLLYACPFGFLIYQNTVLFFIFIVFYLTALTMKILSFHLDKVMILGIDCRDIHMWESVVTGSFFLYMILSGHDVVMLCCSVYPALILHKGFINLGSGLKFFAVKTDDATGKTYSIPILKIKVPRTTNTFRITAAVVSIIIAVWWVMRGAHISLQSFIG